MPFNGPIQTDDAGDPVRTPHSGMFPGSGGPGPGGGFASFAGGSGFGGAGGSARGLQGQRRRTVLGGNVLSDFPGGPQGTDQVPAWMSPGEFVMNPTSASMFGPQLEQMNAEGNAIRFAKGGPVPNPYHPDAQYCSLGGWIRQHPLGAALIGAGAVALPFAAPAIMGSGAAAGALSSPELGAAAGKEAIGLADRYLQPPQQPESAPMNFFPQHYAWGGPVSTSFQPRPQAAPQNPWGQSASTPAPAAPTAPGGAPAPAQNPWGPSGPNLGDVNGTLSGFGQAGFYGPNGSPQTEQAMRDKAVQDARAIGEQAYTSANVGGMDPAQAAAYKTQALSNAGRGSAEAMTNYRASQAEQQAQWAKSLFDKYYGNISADEQARLNEWLNEKLKRVH